MSGGWTYQLVKRGLFVYAVDHGKMAASLHDTGRIEHCAEDGFKFQPPKRKKKVDWLVCDMVEQPSRISLLIGKWLLNGWCRETIFNLKLPMKTLSRSDIMFRKLGGYVGGAEFEF